MTTPHPEALLEFGSHIEGHNARVAVYRDRIEWTRSSALGSWARKDTQMIPLRSIHGVSTHRAGLGYTTVEVHGTASVTKMRTTKAMAEQVKATLLDLLNG